MNNPVQFVCLWCCVPPDFVVQINNFFSLVLFGAVINKRRGKKLIYKTNKSDSSSKMQFAFFILKILKILENYWFCWKSGNESNSRVRGHVLCVIMTQCARISICDSPLINFFQTNYRRSYREMFLNPSQQNFRKSPTK